MRVIDNFIHPDQFQPLQDLMLGHHFPWFYNDGIVGKNMHTIRTNEIKKEYNPYIERIPKRIREKYGQIKF